jgi:aldehyde dehydrogenase (NAD(P)+)
MRATLELSSRAESRRPTEIAVLDQAVATLDQHKREFARLPVVHRARLLAECIERLVAGAPAWVEDGCRAKGLPPELAGEEWLNGPVPTVRLARLLTEQLRCIAAQGMPRPGRRVRTWRGRTCIELFPASRLEQAMFPGYSAEVVLQEGIDAAAARAQQAAHYQRRDEPGRVVCVLGAGNVSSIPPMDVFSKMFIEGCVCLLKMNPVNEWLGPHLERTLAPLLARGYLRIVYGGADVGTYLVEHPGVEEIHITGSERTHDLIVWGPPGPERDERRRTGRPRLSKPVGSELGNVSPVVILPCDYRRDELWYQARNVVTMVVNNASFNCNAAKLLVTSRRWHQRTQFLELVARGLSTVPPRPAYYPGAQERYQQLTGGRAGVRRFGSPGAGELAWALVGDIAAGDPDEPLLQTEAFCGLLAETALDAAEPVGFLHEMAAFLDRRVWGTLNATLILPARLERDPVLGPLLADTIIALRYGTVGINVWPAVAYALGATPWGGHPSATLASIQSGLGWVHNAYMLHGVDKTVMRGPLCSPLRPLWFYDHPRQALAASRLLQMEARPGWRKLPGLALAALA